MKPSAKKTKSLHFVSRESQLSKLNDFLYGLPSSSNLASALIFGESGVGKTSLYAEFEKNSARAPFPVVCFYIDSEVAIETMGHFIRELADSISCRWPELEPYVMAYLNENLHEGSPEQVLRSLLDSLNEYFFQTENGEIKPELRELQFLIAIDDVDRMDPAAIGFLSDLQKALVDDERFTEHHNFLFLGSDKKTSVDTVLKILGNSAAISEIIVAPFSQSESSVLLDALKVEPAQFSSFHTKSGGYPGKLIELWNEFASRPETVNVELARATDILESVDSELGEWIKIASLLKECDPESLGLFLKGKNRERAINWLSLGAVKCIELDRLYPRVRDEDRKCLIAYQQENESSKLKKRLGKVEQLAQVRKVIPKLEHRKALAILGEFEYFDREVLVDLFGENRADEFMDLVDSKTIYFSTSERNFRLSHQAKIIVRLYNQLFPIEEIGDIRKKVKKLWEIRVSCLKDEIKEAEERIHGNESILKEIQTEIASLDRRISGMESRIAQLGKENRRLMTRVKQSRISYFAIGLQLMGIVFLYIAVLYREEILAPVLILAGLSMTVGFLISIKKQGTTRLKVQTVEIKSFDKKKVTEQASHLKSEKLRLATRRDQCKKMMRDSKDQVEKLRMLLSQPYMHV